MKAPVVDRPPALPKLEDPRLVVRLYRELGSVRSVTRQLERGSQFVTPSPS